MKNRYYPKIGFIVFIGMFVLSIASVCRAEEITLTTYYPSPYGVYSEMRLFPKANPTACNSAQEGLMFYSDGSNVLYPRGFHVCGASGWQQIGGGYWTLSSNNLYATNTAAWNVGIGTNATGNAKLRVISNTLGLNDYNIFSDYSGTALFVVKNSGRVGIGKDADNNAALDVKSKPGGYGLVVRDSADNDYVNISADGGRAYFGYNSANNGVDGLFLNSLGNVGIGTASPAEKLHVNGNIFVGGNFAKVGNLAAANSAISVWGTSSGIAVGFPDGKHIGIGQGPCSWSQCTGIAMGNRFTQYAAFYSDSSGTNGEVGIGTYPSGPPVVRMWASNSPGFAAADVIVAKAGYLSLRTQQQERLLINSLGDVGIGVWPWARLDVLSAGVNMPGFDTLSASSRRIFMVPELGAGGYNWLSRNGDSGIFFSNLGAGLVIGPWSSSTVGSLRMDADGRVGLGLSSPAYQLQLSSDSAGKPNGGSWANSSDERIKANINPITDALDKITSLKGVNFEWKNPQEHASQKEEIRSGFLAQEVEKVFPQFISEIEASGRDRELTPDGKIKSLTLPFDFDAYLVEAIKELKAENDALRARVEALEVEAKK